MIHRIMFYQCFTLFILNLYIQRIYAKHHIKNELCIINSQNQITEKIYLKVKFLQFSLEICILHVKLKAYEFVKPFIYS